jgi:hypothetical protein
VSDSRSQDAGSPAYRYVADQIGGRELALILGGLMMLGVVTSLLQFSRSVGLTIGTAIFGSILTLRFAPEVRSALPDALAAILPGPVLALTQDPQAILDPESARALRVLVEHSLPSNPLVADVVFNALRVGLAGSLHWVFLTAAGVFGAGLLVALFMRAVPLLGRGQVGTASAPAPSPSPSPDLARSGRTGSPPALTA